MSRHFVDRIPWKLVMICWLRRAHALEDVQHSQETELKVDLGAFMPLNVS